MNMMGRGRMATPPAPQSASLRRLRIASAILLLLSALCVALIGPIRRVSIYAVAPVPFVMLGAIGTAGLYWYRKARLERSYWTPTREGAHIDAAVRTIHDKRAARAAAKLVADANDGGDLSAAVVTRVGSERSATGYAPRRRSWWLPR